MKTPKTAGTGHSGELLKETKSPDVSNKRNSGLYFSIYSEKPFPKNSIRKNFLPDITKAPGAGS